MQVRRLYAYAVGLLVVGALLWPVSGWQKHDSFPLSYYPMFTTPRKRVVLYSVVGLRQDEEDLARPEVMPPRFIANHEVMQAAVMVRQAAQQGQLAQRHFCEQVAATVAKAADFSHVQALVIVRDVYDPLRYFTADGQRLERKPLHRCRVAR
jgi:hypothetical protein